MCLPAISARSIEKSYGARAVLKGIDLDVAAGSIVGLVGPNGVGKTTLLRILAGLLAPDHGQVKNGSGAGEHAGKENAIGYVPEDPALLEHLTPHESIFLKGTLIGRRKSEIEAMAPALLESWGLQRHEHTLIKCLSHGMKQKLTILLATLDCPRVLLLDEPLNGLDIYSSSTLKCLLKMRADAGTAIVISSHVLELIADVCHRMLILARGTVVYDGSVAAQGADGSALESFVLSRAGVLSEPSDVAVNINRILNGILPSENER